MYIFMPSWLCVVLVICTFILGLLSVSGVFACICDKCFDQEENEKEKEEDPSPNCAFCPHAFAVTCSFKDLKEDKPNE